MEDKTLEAVKLIRPQLDKAQQVLQLLTPHNSGERREALADAEYYVRAAIRALADAT